MTALITELARTSRVRSAGESFAETLVRVSRQ